MSEVDTNNSKEETVVKDIVLSFVGDAFISGYEGAFLRERDEEGNDLITGIWDYWYEQAAKDQYDNDYTVYWTIRDDHDIDDPDEGDACDWYHPFMILTDTGKNVTSRCVFT